MSRRPEDLYLIDLIEACQDARRVVGGRSAEEWMSDSVARYAVLAHLTVVGEAANRLGPELRRRYDGMPWREIIAFRNVAVHEYFAVEWHVVWRIVAQQLPSLLEYALGMLRAEHPELVASVGG
jgi:uncharacterized protein with HEPN domain